MIEYMTSVKDHKALSVKLQLKGEKFWLSKFTQLENSGGK